ncbi:MAG TPA: hypothetical protein VGV92_08770 [Gammaproteobacteria bacterium]|nr:hypothetical protein [Gammaproteobacteria bacterium]
MSHEIVALQNQLVREQIEKAVLSLVPPRSIRIAIPSDLLDFLSSRSEFQTPEFKALYSQWFYAKFVYDEYGYYDTELQNAYQKAEGKLTAYYHSHEIIQKSAEAYLQAVESIYSKNNNSENKTITGFSQNWRWPSLSSAGTTAILFLSTVNAAAAQAFIPRSSNTSEGSNAVGHASARAPLVPAIPPVFEQEIAIEVEKKPKEKKPTEKSRVLEQPVVPQALLEIRNEFVALLPSKSAGFADNPATIRRGNPPDVILAFLRVIDATMTSNGIDWKKVDEFIQSRSDLDIPEMLVREAGQNQRPQASYLLAILALKQGDYAQALAFMAQCKLQNLADPKNDHQFFATAIKYYESLEKKVVEGGAKLTIEELTLIQKNIDVIRKIDAVKETIPDALLPTVSSGPTPLRTVWEKTIVRINDLTKICQDNINKARKKLNQAQPLAQLHQQLSSFRDSLIAFNQDSTKGVADHLVVIVDETTNPLVLQLIGNLEAALQNPENPRLLLVTVELTVQRIRQIITWLKTNRNSISPEQYLRLEQEVDKLAEIVFLVEYFKQTDSGHEVSDWETKTRIISKAPKAVRQLRPNTVATWEEFPGIAIAADGPTIKLVKHTQTVTTSSHPAKEKTSQVQRDLDWVLSRQTKKGMEKKFADELGVNLELKSLRALPPEDALRLTAALKMQDPAKDIVTVRDYAHQGIQLALQYMSHAASRENKFGNAAALALQLVRLNPTDENYGYLVKAVSSILEREYSKAQEMVEDWDQFNPEHYDHYLKWFEILQRAHRYAPSASVGVIDRWKQLPNREALAKKGLQIPSIPPTEEAKKLLDEQFERRRGSTTNDELIALHHELAAKGRVESSLALSSVYGLSEYIEYNDLPFARLLVRQANYQALTPQQKEETQKWVKSLEPGVGYSAYVFLNKWIQLPVRRFLKKTTNLDTGRFFWPIFYSLAILMTFSLFTYDLFLRRRRRIPAPVPVAPELNEVKKTEKVTRPQKTPEQINYEQNLKKLKEIKQNLLTIENRKADVDAETFATWEPLIQKCRVVVDQEYLFEKASELENVLPTLLVDIAALEVMVSTYEQAEKEKQEKAAKAAKAAKREAKAKRVEVAKQVEAMQKREDAQKAYDINHYKLEQPLKDRARKITKIRTAVEKKLEFVEGELAKLNAKRAALSEMEINWKKKEEMDQSLQGQMDTCYAFKTACFSLIELCGTFTGKYSDAVGARYALEEAVLLEGCVQELEALEVTSECDYPVLLRALKARYQEMEDKLGIVRAVPNDNNNNNNNDNNARPDEEAMDEPEQDSSSTSSEKAEEKAKAVSPKTSSLLSQSAGKFHAEVSAESHAEVPAEPFVKKNLESDYQPTRQKTKKKKQKPKREEGVPVMKDGFVEFNLSNRVDCLRPLVNKPTVFDEHLFLERLAMHCHLLRLHRFLLAAYRERGRYPVKAPFCEASYGQFLDDTCNMLMHNYFVVEKFGHANLLKFVQKCYVNREMDAKTPALVCEKPFYQAMRAKTENWINLPRTIPELINDFQTMCGYLSRLHDIGEKMGMATKLYDSDYLAACQMTLSIVGEVCARIYELCPKFKEIAKENPDKSLLSLVNFLHRCRKYMRNVTKHEEDVSAAFDAWRHKFPFIVEDVFQTDIQAVLKAGVELNRAYNKEKFQELQVTLEKLMPPSLSPRF